MACSSLLRTASFVITARTGISWKVVQALPSAPFPLATSATRSNHRAGASGLELTPEFIAQRLQILGMTIVLDSQVTTSRLVLMIVMGMLVAAAHGPPEDDECPWSLFLKSVRSQA